MRGDTDRWNVVGINIWSVKAEDVGGDHRSGPRYDRSGGSKSDEIVPHRVECDPFGDGRG